MSRRPTTSSGFTDKAEDNKTDLSTDNGDVTDTSTTAKGGEPSPAGKAAEGDTSVTDTSTAPVTAADQAAAADGPAPADQGKAIDDADAERIPAADGAGDQPSADVNNLANETLLTTDPAAQGNGPIKGLANQVTGAKANIYDPDPGDKPSTELSLDELTERLAASGIHLNLSDADDVGRGYKHATLGDQPRPEVSRNLLSSDEDIVSWAHHEAVRLFPVSDYALTYGAVAPKDDPTSATN